VGSCFEGLFVKKVVESKFNLDTWFVNCDFLSFESFIIYADISKAIFHLFSLCAMLSCRNCGSKLKKKSET